MNRLADDFGRFGSAEGANQSESEGDRGAGSAGGDQGALGDGFRGGAQGGECVRHTAVSGVPGARKQTGVEQEQGGGANRTNDAFLKMKPADQIEHPGLFA